MPDLTHEQVKTLLAALETAFQQTDDPEGAMTMGELCEALGIGHAAVRTRLKALGPRLEVVRVTRQSPLCDYPQRVIAYRIREAP